MAPLFEYFCLNIFIRFIVMLLFVKFVNWMFVFFSLSFTFILLLFVLYFIGIIAESNNPFREIKWRRDELVYPWSVLI